MRICSGTLSGRKIEPPLSMATRPMMDRVRQALFNILAHRDWGKYIGDLFDDNLYVLDAFCGTGALAFEALSLGARHAFLFDKDPQALKIARLNATSLGVAEKCGIIPTDATLPPPHSADPCRLVFLAPPYRKGLIGPAYEALDTQGWIAKHAVIVAETARKEKLDELKECDVLVSRSYADTTLHFLLR